LVKARILSAAAAVALAACGGGGGASETGSSAAAAATAAPATTATAAAATPQAADCGMFPPSAIFNTRIDDASRFPAHASSAAWIALAGATTPFMANWGASGNPADTANYWGLPVNTIVAGGTQWPLVSLDGGYPQKSDCATLSDGSGIVQGCASVPASNRRFPFPSGGVLVEGNGDRHVLVVDRAACRLWEAYDVQQSGGQWSAQSTATWDLRSNALRPDDWGSADAAGLPITPLLAKAGEAATGEIRHALRVTFRDAALALAHTWPARFAAGADNPGAIPFGAVLRLKAGFAIPDSWSPQAKAVALAAQRYGLYVADNGMDFYVQGEPGDAWDAGVWQQLRAITLADMEFVEIGAITRDPRWSADSMAASW
jgi:hypothetical protein